MTPPDIFSADFIRDPYPFYRQMRDHHPLYRHPASNAYILSRYDDVRAALTDPSLHHPQLCRPDRAPARRHPRATRGPGSRARATPARGAVPPGPLQRDLRAGHPIHRRQPDRRLARPGRGRADRGVHHAVCRRRSGGRHRPAPIRHRPLPHLVHRPAALRREPRRRPGRHDRPA